MEKPNDIQRNNKRILKNTLLLYFRMIVVTLLSLVTVKYTLQILGVSDYGVYNIVGGVVTFLTFVTATISSATQRFLAYELGRQDERSYNDIFNMLLLVFGIVSIFILAIIEAFAHPVIYHWLQIPTGREAAAEVVYHLSALAFVASVVVIPFVSSILANEKMGVYAYITIADTVAKLMLLGILLFSPFDKLISYAVGIMVIAIATNAIYVVYNQQKIRSTRIYYYWDGKVFRTLTGYTGWSFFGSVSAVMCNQGMTILMNIFFGVAVNAAKAISDRIMTIVQSFVMNFYMAVSPQIVKTYAAGDLAYTVHLAYSSTRLAFYLMMVLSVPTIILLDDIMQLWLGDTCTPDMILFTRLSLIFAIVNVFETPITFMMRATGSLKAYQLYVGMLTLAIIPVSYVLYKMGLPAYTAFVCQTVIYAVVQFVRVWVARRHYPITMSGYIREVLLRPVLVSVAVTLAAIMLYAAGLSAWGNAVITTLLLLALIWLYGLSANEKTMVKTKLNSKLQKR